MLSACQCVDHRYTGNCAEGSGKCECKVEYSSPDCTSCSYGYFGYPHCRGCECFLNGTRGYHCEAVGGQCPCKPNFGGKLCRECNPGYYGYPDCLGECCMINIKLWVNKGLHSINFKKGPNYDSLYQGPFEVCHRC